MAKKKSAPQPVTAEEPARPEEQLRFEETSVAPPSPRSSTRTPRSGNSGSSRRSDRVSYSARSAGERRASRGGKSRSSGSTDLRSGVVASMLENPTLQVSEAELRQEYGYVISDLRSMAVLSIALVITLVVLAQVLPK